MLVGHCPFPSRAFKDLLLNSNAIKTLLMDKRETKSALWTTVVIKSEQSRAVSLPTIGGAAYAYIHMDQICILRFWKPRSQIAYIIPSCTRRITFPFPSTRRTSRCCCHLMSHHVITRLFQGIFQGIPPKLGRMGIICPIHETKNIDDPVGNVGWLTRSLVRGIPNVVCLASDLLHKSSGPPDSSLSFDWKWTTPTIMMMMMAATCWLLIWQWNLVKRIPFDVSYFPLLMFGRRRRRRTRRSGENLREEKIHDKIIFCSRVFDRHLTTFERKKIVTDMTVMLLIQSSV